MNNETETQNAQVIGRAQGCERCAELELKVTDLKLRNSLLRNRTDLPLHLRREYEDAMKEIAKVPELETKNAALQKEIESLKRIAHGRQIRRNGLF